MRLYGLAVSTGDNTKFIGIYPTLSALRKALIDIANYSEGTIAIIEIPALTQLRHDLDMHEDFFHEFSDGTKIHVQEIEDKLVSDAIKYYHLERNYNIYQEQEVT